MGVDCLVGEVVGVVARMVEGERANGDSGRRNGEARGELKERGDGLYGVEFADCWGVNCCQRCLLSC